MEIKYKPLGVCAREMTVAAKDGVITEAKIVGGCSGNSYGICRLVVGMKLEDAISRLEGIRCGLKHTSCPDQLAIAMKKLS